MPPGDNGKTSRTLADILDRILDKGVVINADISVSLVGVEILGIKLKATIASLETAARYGLLFPSGINMETPGWKDLRLKETCPECGKESPKEDLLASGCPWCGWLPAKLKAIAV